MSMKGIAAADQSVLDNAELIALVRQTKDEFEAHISRSLLESRRFGSTPSAARTPLFRADAAPLAPSQSRATVDSTDSTRRAIPAQDNWLLTKLRRNLGPEGELSGSVE